MIKVIKGKPIKGIEEALREQIAYEKKVSKTFERMAIRLKQQVNELKAELCGMEDELAKATRRIEELEAESVFQAENLAAAQNYAEICIGSIEWIRERMEAMANRGTVIKAVPSAEQCCEGTCDECGECRI